MKGEEYTFSLKKGEVESVKENHFKLDATHAQIVWYHITAQPSPAQHIRLQRMSQPFTWVGHRLRHARY